MLIKLVCLEDGFISYGFRKFAAYVHRINHNTKCYFVSTNFNKSIVSHIMQTYGGQASTRLINNVALELADADIIGFSSMTGYADLTKKVISKVKEISDRAYVIWGGIHPIVNPEDAILSDADAICTGEGEFAFREFLGCFVDERDFSSTKNFWFKQKEKIIRNGFRSLMTTEDMNNLPAPMYSDGELVYKNDSGFVKMSIADYVASSGLAYHTIWSIGCPFRCVFCGNTQFIKNDPNYKVIRYPSVEYIIEEIKKVRKKHPHISTICFHDDSFISIEIKDISKFALLWRKEINLPFVVYGVHPNYVNYEKIEILTWAGLNRVRMGIQSGSKRILNFYNRGTTIKKINESTQIIAKFSKYHIPPAYDIIVDNPLETKGDIIDTLELLYQMPRPYTLYIYALKVIPNTILEERMMKQGIDIDKITTYYFATAPSVANILIYMITFFKPPKWIFDKILTKVEPYNDSQSRYPLTAFTVRLLYMIKRGLDHLRFMDFSIITGMIGFILWKCRVLIFWNKFMIPKYRMPYSRISQITAHSGLNE